MITKVDKSLVRVLELAEKIEADIRRRKLGPGQRYLSTAEVTKLLRADSKQVNRALQSLVKRDVLERRQRLGTFISNNQSKSGRRPLERLFVVMPENRLFGEGILDSDFLFGLQSQLPATKIRLEYVPTATRDEHIKGLLSESLDTNQADGFVLISTPIAVQRIFAELAMPTVVFGGVFRSIDGLPSLDRDNQAIGRLLCEHLLRGGARRFLLLMCQDLLPGDHSLLDSVRDALSEADVPLRGLTVRCLPPDENEIQDEVRRFAAASSEKPGIISRSPIRTQAAISAIEGLRGTSDQQIALAACDHFRSSSDAPVTYPYARPTIDFEQQGAMLAKVLLSSMAGRGNETTHELIPVELFDPKTNAKSIGV